jgi:hypothetical protein
VGEVGELARDKAGMAQQQAVLQVNPYKPLLTPINPFKPPDSPINPYKPL